MYYQNNEELTNKLNISPIDLLFYILIKISLIFTDLRVWCIYIACN